MEEMIELPTKEEIGSLLIHVAGVPAVPMWLRRRASALLERNYGNRPGAIPPSRCQEVIAALANRPERAKKAQRTKGCRKAGTVVESNRKIGRHGAGQREPKISDRRF
jgi:hypothetical protein